MNLRKISQIKVKRHYESGELCLSGCEYTSQCPKCSQKKSFESKAIFLDRELGGKHINCITFTCDKCAEEWEDEFYLFINVDVAQKCPQCWGDGFTCKWHGNKCPKECLLHAKCRGCQVTCNKIFETEANLKQRIKREMGYGDDEEINLEDYRCGICMNVWDCECAKQGWR
jgi:hypothetical protein